MSILEKGGFGTGAEVGTYRSSVRGALAAVSGEGPYALLNMRAIEDIYAVAGAGGCKAAGGLKCKYARPSTKKGHMYDYEIKYQQSAPKTKKKPPRRVPTKLVWRADMKSSPKGAGRHKVGPAPSTGAVTSFEVAVLSCAVGSAHARHHVNAYVSSTIRIRGILCQESGPYMTRTPVPEVPHEVKAEHDAGTVTVEKGLGHGKETQNTYDQSISRNSELTNL
ncbi:hypothetical protein C8R43DRAFT_965652 [Mycena crocata]|nr:hypothetical protein C8R43DRAFT_965652 [Mycena crocata]